MIKKAMCAVILILFAAISFGQQNDEIEYVGETGHRLSNTLDIIYARMEQPAYHNEFAQFILDAPDFPKQEGNTPMQLEAFRNAVNQWVQSNPEKINQLWEAREDAAAKFANPDPNYTPPNK